MAAEVRKLPVADRAVYTTVKHRAEDLTEGDAIRNRFGKWDVVSKVVTNGFYTHVTFETGNDLQVRTVALIDVQKVKPS